jgi:hypothetical protein
MAAPSQQLSLVSFICKEIFAVSEHKAHLVNYPLQIVAYKK